MLKRIEVADVRLGMFIHKLEGPWLKHPFWRNKFLLTDPSTLADLKASEVEGVLIDLDKGGDTLSSGAQAPARRRPLVSTSHSVPASPANSAAQNMADRIRLERMRTLQPQTPAVSNVIPFDPRAAKTLSTAREVDQAKGVLVRSNRVLASVFEQARLGKAISVGQIEPVIEDLFSSIQRNPHAFNGLMRIRRENSALYAHGLAVSALMIALARQMHLDVERAKEAGMAGLLMDVGMGHLPIDVATILDDLTEAEMEIVKTHTTLGHEFLIMGGEFSDEVTRVCLEHHERCDGSGYPQQLMGKEIGLFGKMAAICDTYDSMTSDRPHRPRIDPNTALEMMRGMEGLFDHKILDQFIESVGVYPIGSVVRLTTGRLALVVDQNIADYTRPRVWAFFDVNGRRVIKPEDIDLLASKGRVEIICSDDAASYGVENFPAIREMVFNSACKAMQ